jgi:hypothetical protein
VFPWLDKVQSAIDRVRVPQRLRIHSGAGDLGINETALRQALHARGMLTVGIPKRLFAKYQAASRLSIKRVIATYTNVSLVVGNSS